MKFDVIDGIAEHAVTLLCDPYEWAFADCLMSPDLAQGRGIGLARSAMISDRGVDRLLGRSNQAQSRALECIATSVPETASL